MTWVHSLARTTIAAILLAAATLGEAVAETRYFVIDLGTLGGPQSFALDINNKQQISGNSSAEPGTAFPLQAFRWQNGFLVNLGTLPGAANAFSRGFAINDAGSVVGESGNGPSFAFRADDGVLTRLPSLNPEGTGVANDINNDGQIAGASVNPEARVRPFLIDGDAIYDLGTLEGSDFSSGRACRASRRGLHATLHLNAIVL